MDLNPMLHLNKIIQKLSAKTSLIWTKLKATKFLNSELDLLIKVMKKIVKTQMYQYKKKIKSQTHGIS